MDFLREPVGIGIDARAVAGIADRLTEGPDVLRALVRADPVATAAAGFHIQEHRQVESVAGHQLDHHGGLFDCFRLRDRLREEIDADLQARVPRACDIGAEPGILNQCADGGAAVAAADDGEGDAGGAHRVPVDAAVPGRDIDTDGGVSCLQNTLAVKMVRRTLDDLLAGHIIAVLVKEIGSAVQRLPAGVTVGSAHHLLPEEAVVLVVVLHQCFPVGVAVLHIERIAALVLQAGVLICRAVDGHAAGRLLSAVLGRHGDGRFALSDEADFSVAVHGSHARVRALPAELFIGGIVR